jgi:hypothetical protein
LYNTFLNVYLRQQTNQKMEKQTLFNDLIRTGNQLEIEFWFLCSFEKDGFFLVVQLENDEIGIQFFNSLN